MMSASDERNSGSEGNTSLAREAGAFFGAILRSWIAPLDGIAPNPEEPPVLAAARAIGGRVGRGVKVLATILIVVLASALVAVMLVGEVFRSTSFPVLGLQIGTTGVTLLAMITATKEIMLLGRRFLLYVKSGEGDYPFEEFVKLGAVALALSVSIAVWAPIPDSEVGLPLDLTRPSLLAVGASRDEYYPFLFGLADGPPLWSRGVALSQAQKRDVETLVASLQACVGSEPGQGVSVQVVGYADANEFRNAEVLGESSLELNRQAANRRALALTAEIRRHLEGGTGVPGLSVLSPAQWPEGDPEAMTRSPRYLRAKALHETDGRDQGLFNRRAEVVVAKFGLCERLEIQAAR
jgi:hypothetical protein